jgi:hypothetical protein
MNGYFEQLESELRAAVPRAAVQPWPRRPWPLRFTAGTLVAAVGLVVAIAVAGLAVALLSHVRHAVPARRPAAPPGRPAAESLSLTDLQANFAELRRPQTAADRRWHDPTMPSPRTIRSLTRLVRTLGNGDRVLLTVQRPSPRSVGHVAGGDVLTVVVASPAVFSGATFSGADRFTVIPLGVLSVRGPVTWVSVVPDSVRSVTWRFSCRPEMHHLAGCRGSRTITVNARNNVAVGATPDVPCLGGRPTDCLRASSATWHGAHGRVITTYLARSSHPITRPPGITFVPSARPPAG